MGMIIGQMELAIESLDSVILPLAGKINFRVKETLQVGEEIMV